MATAQVLYQRFYYMSSFLRHSCLDVAMACLFLASKVEENSCRLRFIINTFDYLIKQYRGLPTIPMETYGDEFYHMKHGLITSEMYILRNLAFNVHVQLPYGLLVNYLQCLGLSEHEMVPQLSWNYLNDSFRSNVHVCYQPPTIACACIFLASRKCQIKLPTNPPWWEVFDTSEENLTNVAGHIMNLYTYRIPKNLPLTTEELQSCIAE